jgi:hypothetical protein
MEIHNLDKIISRHLHESDNDRYDSSTRCAITIWVPASIKEKYNHLQKISNKSFSKVLNEITTTSIDLGFDKIKEKG